MRLALPCLDIGAVRYAPVQQRIAGRPHRRIAASQTSHSPGLGHGQAASKQLGKSVNIAAQRVFICLFRNLHLTSFSLHCRGQRLVGIHHPIGYLKRDRRLANFQAA